MPAIDSTLDSHADRRLHPGETAEHKLAPSAEADRRTLIRRLTFDLHGLPPTPEEVDAFLADDQLRRLRDSWSTGCSPRPRYGERWGRHWLDVVHYGESHGYDKDKPRPNAWPYRDYVIRSLNDDKPYDRFVAEQLAGDVLYPDDPQAIVATGFIAAGPWDFVGHVELREGTVDKEIARSNDRDDMVATTMSTFASLTVHCARCHDHKFDPIRQEDYYRLQAVFAGVDRADRPYDADPQTARSRATLAGRNSAVECRPGGGRSPRGADHQPRDRGARRESGRSGQATLAAFRRRTSRARRSAITARSRPRPTPPNGCRSIWASRRPSTGSCWCRRTSIYGGHKDPGFGFPPRFKVEVIGRRPISPAHACWPTTRAADFPHPGDTP